MQPQAGTPVFQNPTYSAKLSGVIRYENAQPVAQHLAFFVINEDLTVQCTGGDPFGQYVYSGSVTVDGRLSLVRKYYMNDHLPALFLQGNLQDDGRLSGVVLETVPPYGTVHRGTFEFTQMTHFWKGEYSEAGGRKGPLELSFFMGPTIYGFGKLNGSTYTIKGSYEPFTHRVVLHEFNSNKAMKQRLFEGVYTPAGGKIQGTFKTPSNDTGSFNLEFCQEGFSAAPRMDVIDAQAPMPTKTTADVAASQPNYAKPPPLKPPGASATSSGQPASAQTVGVPMQGADLALPPNFAQLAHPQMSNYGMPAPVMGYPPMQQTGMVWNAGSMAPVHSAPMAYPQQDIPLTQRVNGLDTATKMDDLLHITQQVHQGRVIPVQDLLAFYDYCKDNKFKIALTQAVAGYVVGMNPVSYERAVTKNSSPDVQLTIIQAFGAGVRGQLSPDLKQRILNSIVFDQEKKTASAILSTL